MEIRICFQLFIMLCLQCTFVNGNSRKDVFATEGSTVTLKCPVSSVEFGAWKKMFLKNYSSDTYTDGLEINPKLPHADRLRVLVNNITGNYDLHIMNVSSFDEGVYRCSFIQKNKLTTSNVGLYIERLPTDLRFISHVSGTDIAVMEGQEQTLVCVVQSGAPRESLVIVHKGLTVSSGGPGRLNYSLIAKQSDHMSMVECIADSPLLIKPLSTRVRILVKFTPRVIITEGSALTATEGRQLRLTCSAECYPGLKKMVWALFTENELDLHEGNSSIFVRKLNRNQTGEYICRVENEVGTGQAKITVTVQYPPEVDVQIVLQTYLRKRFDCLPKGVPTSYTFHAWEHKSVFGEHIRFLQGYDNGTLILNTSKASEIYQDNGIYVCTVTNGVASAAGTINQKGMTTLYMTGRPVFVTENLKVQYGKKGSTSTLIFYIYSNPRVTSISLQWGKSKRIVADNEFSMEKREVWHVFYRKRIRVHGYIAKVETFQMTAEDFRNYTINAFNKNGNDSFTFQIKAVDIPEMPVSINVKPAENTVTVSWMKGFNGGYQQHFYVEIRKETEQTWNIYGPFEESGDRYESCELKGLKPGSDYILRMFSNNTIGKSNTTDSVRTKTTEHMSYSAYIGIATLVVIVVIGTILIGKGLYQNYKKRREKELRDVINANAENAGVDPVENALYQSQNLPNSHTMSSAAYSTIEGRGKPPVDHLIVSYSAADSDSDADICPGYANSNFEYRESTFIRGFQFSWFLEISLVLGFLNSWSEALPVANQENPSKGKPVHNDDCNQRSDTSKGNQLNYSEIIFCPSSSSKFVIRGLENKTTYSEVDFSKRASPLSSSDGESDSDDEDDCVNIAGIKHYVKRDTSCC